MDKVETLLKKIEEEARIRGYPIIGPEKRKIVEEIVKQYKPRKVLEIGTLHGYSAIIIARASNARVVTIELSRDAYSIAMKNIAKARLKSKIKVILGDAIKVIPKLRQKFDMVFIDARKRDYLSYLKLAERKLSKHAIILADNAREDIVKDYLDYVRSKYKSKSIKTVSFLNGKQDFMELSFKF